MNKTYINLGLFAAGGIIMWFFAFPFYTGNGQNILNRKSIMDYRRENAQNQKNLNLATELKEKAKDETEAFQKIDPDLKKKIEAMIPGKVDIPRLFNDMTVLVKASNLKLDSISYIKASSPDGIDELNYYKINMSLSGDYLSFRTFVKSLQSSLQLYRISSIFFSSVKSSDSRNIADGTDVSAGQRFNISFDAYEFKN